MAHSPTICPTEAQLLELYPVFRVTPYTTGLNAWTLVVGSVAAGPYIVTVDSVPYAYPATGSETIEELRDAILAVMVAGTHTNWMASASSTDAVVMTSLVDGRGLSVASNLGPTGAEMSLAETMELTGTEVIHNALSFAGCLVCDWGCSTYDACMAAAVHWLKMWGQGQTKTGGPSGPIASMGQGPFSVSFANNQMSSGADGWWGGSPEGANFLMLRRQQGPQFVRMRAGGRCAPRSYGRRGSW